MGGIIGGLTNEIAIRLTFRPYKEKHLFGMSIPFTPGLIPKDREKIALAVGDSISENLMNKEVLEKKLLSTEIITKIGETYDNFVAKQKMNTETLKEFLCHFITKEDVEKIQKDAGGELATQLHHYLAQTNLGTSLARAAVDHALKKMEWNIFAMLLNAKTFLELIREPAQDMLAKHINEIIRNNSGEIAYRLIGTESDRLLYIRVCDLLAGHDEQLQQARRMLIEGYEKTITTHLPRVLATINISDIISERINAMDMAKSEEIIRSVINKELRAIVWLGALLGCVIGLVNSFF